MLARRREQREAMQAQSHWASSESDEEAESKIAKRREAIKSKSQSRRSKKSESESESSSSSSDDEGRVLPGFDPEELKKEREAEKKAKAKADKKGKRSDSASDSDNDSDSSSSDDDRRRRSRKHRRDRRRHRKSRSPSSSSSSDSSDESSESEEDRSKRKRRKERKRRKDKKRKRSRRSRSSSESGSNSSNSSESESERSSSSESDASSSRRKKQKRSPSPGTADGVAAAASTVPDVAPAATAAAPPQDERKSLPMDDVEMLNVDPGDMWEGAKARRTHADGDEEDEDELVGPRPPSLDKPPDIRSYGQALMPGEGEAIAGYVQAGKRIPRRGEIGLTSHEIENFESLGYVMSGSRHKRMNAIRQRKENQVYSAEEKRALSLLNFEEKTQREKRLMNEFRKFIGEKVGATELDEEQGT